MSDLRDIAVKYAHLLSAGDYSKLLNLSDEIERLNKRHDDFLQEFWATNAMNAKMQAVVDAAKLVRDYPEIREYIGTLLYYELAEALAALKETDDE